MRKGQRLIALVLGSFLSISAVGSVGAAGGIASPAATFFRPDARISKVCSNIPEWQACDPAIAGDNIYNGTAKNQNRNHIDYLTYSTERDPRVVVFKISIQNEGNVADRFSVDADGVSSGYKVKFFRQSNNITSAVEAGMYRTPSLAPGASVVIKAKVVMPCDSWDNCGQQRAERLVTVRSVGDASMRDAVKFVRKIWVCTC